VKRNAADGLFTRPSILRSAKAIYQGWVEKYLGNGNNIRFESPQRLIKQIAWPDPGLKIKLFNIVNNVPQFVLQFVLKTQWFRIAQDPINQQLNVDEAALIN
jgi:hypothetical protein